MLNSAGWEFFARITERRDVKSLLKGEKMFTKSLKNDKARIIMYGLELAIALFGIIYFILAIAGIGMEMVPEGSRVSSGIATVFLGMGLIAIEVVFRYKLPIMLHVIYALYTFFSNVIGSCLGLFRIMFTPFLWRGITIYDFGWFDKIMHSILGYVLCIVAVYLAIKSNIWNKSIIGDILIILAISMGFASLWEIFEFTCDSILPGQDMQRGPELLDTMVDMTLHLIFTVIFIVQYILSKVTKFSFGMSFMVANLSTGGSIRKPKSTTDITNLKIDDSISNAEYIQPISEEDSNLEN